MTVTMHVRRRSHWLKWQLRLLACQEFAQQERTTRQRIGCGTRQQRAVLVTQGEQARRFQTDHRQFAAAKYLERAPGFAACLVHHASGQEAASAAHWPPAS